MDNSLIAIAGGNKDRIGKAVVNNMNYNRLAV